MFAVSHVISIMCICLLFAQWCLPSNPIIYLFNLEKSRQRIWSNFCLQVLMGGLQWRENQTLLWCEQWEVENQRTKVSAQEIFIRCKEMKVVKHWKMFSWEVVESPSLDIFQIQLDKVLSDLIWPWSWPYFDTVCVCL